MTDGTHPLRTIDVHAHFLPPSVQRRAGEDWLPSLQWVGDRQLVDYEGRTTHSVSRHEFGDIDGVLATTERIGLDGLVLSPWVTLLADNFDGDLARRVAGMQNEGMSRAAEAAPDRVFALGTVPMRDPDLAARELERLMAERHLHGVEISSTIDDRFLGDERFLPFWAAAEALRAIVFVHPSQRGLGMPVLERFRLWNLVGNPTETALTAADMVMSGLLERHPRLRVILAHAGGTLLSVRGRLVHGWTIAPEVRTALRSSPDESLRRFHYDTVCHDPDMLRRLVEFAGPERVLLGSDYPFDMGPDDPVGFVRDAGLGEHETKAMLAENALALLGLAELAA